MSLNPFKFEDLSLQNSFDFFAAKRSLAFFNSLDFLGRDLDNTIACNVAKCLIDPISKITFAQISEFIKSKLERDGTAILDMVAQI